MLKMRPKFIPHHNKIIYCSSKFLLCFIKYINLLHVDIYILLSSNCPQIYCINLI